MEAADPLDPDNVHGRESFLAFVRALVEDREAALEAERRKPTDPRILGLVPDAGGWYNFTIEAYLEAALRWAEDSDGGVRGAAGEAVVEGFRVVPALRQDLRVADAQRRRAEPAAAAIRGVHGAPGGGRC